jgi:hypothetical protein
LESPFEHGTLNEYENSESYFTYSIYSEQYYWDMMLVSLVQVNRLFDDQAGFVFRAED